jgi:Spy/CpxP family protein refolding chaperone
MQSGRGERGLFRGIKLSDTEKAKLKDIRAKYAPEQKQLRASLQPAMQEVRAARQKGDSVAARAAFDRTKDGRDKMTALMSRQRAEVRSALTPENQKQFDANVQQLAQRRAEWEKGGRKGRRGERNGRTG